jgi:DNA polymerase-3 subunit alpha
VADFSIDEKLKKEKENLGFYVSEHPLKVLQKSARLLSPVNLSDLAEQSSRKLISAVVMINAIKKITTRQGKPMVFLGLEDITGQTEGIVFSETYEQINHLLEEEATLMIWGKVDKKDDKTNIIIESVAPVDQLQMIMINLTPQQAIDIQNQNILKSLLQEHGGDKAKAKVPVFGIVGHGEQRQMIRFSRKYWVQNEFSTVNVLKNAGFTVELQPLVNR